MKKILAAAVIAVASVSVYAFTPGMTDVAINAEVTQRVAAGETNEVIAAAALAAGISGTVVQNSLVAAGRDSTEVFNAMVAANYSPDSILPPTAAGAVAAAAAAPAGGFTGFSGGSFGQSRAASVGGGGRSSVSPS